MNLSVDLNGIDADGQAIRATAHVMPAPDIGPACDCGNDEVTSTVEHVLRQINDNLLGAAAEMYRLGGVLSDASRTLAETDRQIARG
jgi:hypothetical protein